MDLCPTVGGNAIDQALRTRAATLAQLHRAMELTAARVGNRSRRQLLLDSRAEPWSEAERRFHRLPRDAGITGWQANRPVVLKGSTCYVDMIFRKLKLVIEIDGRLYHTGTEVFETDRRRQNLLVLDGWFVLRFTWTMIEEHPEEVIAIVRQAEWHSDKLFAHSDSFVACGAAASHCTLTQYCCTASSCSRRSDGSS